MIPLSVIIPFYNSKSDLKTTAESLLNQSLNNIEYIFVDDGSSDGSKTVIEEVLSSFPQKHSQVIITHSSPDGKNHGIAQARQTGLDLAHGEYVIFCDSDDWVDADYYEQLYHAAVSRNATLAVGDYCIVTNKERNKIVSPDIESWDDFKQYPKWFHLSLWNRLIKLSLIKDNNICFFNGINFSEDYGFVMRVYYFSKKNCNIHSNLYYYYNKTNNSSLTHTLSFTSQLHRIKCIQMLDDYFRLKNENIDDCSLHKIEKYSSKDALLTVSQFALWKITFPEATRMILEDSTRSYIYKTVYILGQYVSWRILWLYHIVHKILSSRKHTLFYIFQLNKKTYAFKPTNKSLF